jgi:hypothetical protein
MWNIYLSIILCLGLLSTMAIPICPVEGGESFLIEFKDDLLTVKVEDASLKEVLGEIGRRCDIKIFSDDLSDEKVTIRFQALPLDEGILRIIDYHNSILLYEERGIDADQSSPPSPIVKEVIVLPNDGKGINRGDVHEPNLDSPINEEDGHFQVLGGGTTY